MLTSTVQGRVLAALRTRGSESGLSVAMLAADTGLTQAQVRSALARLNRHRFVFCFDRCEGRCWWEITHRGMNAEMC